MRLHNIHNAARWMIVAAALGVAFLASKRADAAETGLAHANVANYLGPLDGTAAGRTWVRPTNDTAVLSCPPGTAAADCAWGKPAFAWRRFGDLAPDAFVNVCAAAIEPGPFAPPNRPTVDPNCGDPCGCGNELDKKTNILKSAVVLTSTAPGNTTGTFKITWTPPTQNTDGSALTDLAGFWIYSAANGSPLGKLAQIKSPTMTSSDLSGYGPGSYQFALSAYNAAGTESALTNAVPITVVSVPKVPGTPANVSITRVELSTPP